jgi:hypothetical protein
LLFLFTGSFKRRLDNGRLSQPDFSHRVLFDRPDDLPGKNDPAPKRAELLQRIEAIERQVLELKALMQ